MENVACKFRTKVGQPAVPITACLTISVPTSAVVAHVLVKIVTTARPVELRWLSDGSRLIPARANNPFRYTGWMLYISSAKN